MLDYDMLEEGMVIKALDGHECLRNGQECEVKRNRKGFYVECDRGRHYLNTQLIVPGFGYAGKEK